MTILQGNSRSIAQKIGEICTVQADLQPISFNSDRLLDVAYLQRQSLWFDIRILWLTFIKVLRRDGCRIDGPIA